MLTLLTFGTLWFWLVTVAVFIAITAFVECEKTVAAGFCLIATLVAFYLCGNGGMLTWVKDNPLHLLYYFLTYLGVACVWGVIKWTLFVHGENDKYNDAKAKFLKDNDATEMTQALKEKWTEHAKEGSYSRYSSYEGVKFIFPAPEARDHKGRVIGWMTYWPWSLFWTMINDPIRKLMRFLYNRISGLLNKISKHAYRDTADDIVVAPKKGKRAGAYED